MNVQHVEIRVAIPGGRRAEEDFIAVVERHAKLRGGHLVSVESEGREHRSTLEHFRKLFGGKAT